MNNNDSVDRHVLGQPAISTVARQSVDVASPESPAGGRAFKASAAVVLLATVAVLAFRDSHPARWQVPAGRSEVVFWHFWGGKDRPVVETIVERFNAAQDEFFVRPVAMPGNNLDLKFFLSVPSGKPPDVLNQHNPIVAA